jgi:predicted transport protein
MLLFKKQKNDLIPIKELKIDLERDLQTLTEQHLKDIFDLKFISSEFALHNFRIDTLAFDTESNAFAIIEYKRDRSFSIIDQGYSYLGLLLNNKADFILEYNEKTGSNLIRSKIDWSQSKVIFVANSYTTYQTNAINFQNLPIELWEARKYNDDIISYNQIKSSDTSESINVISKNTEIDKIAREVRTYSIDDHFPKGWEKGRDIFETLRVGVLLLDNRLEESPQKNYIGYKLNSKNIIELVARKNKIIVNLLRAQPKDVIDPEKKVYYQKNSFKNYHKHITEYEVNNSQDVIYAMSLIRQVYERYTYNKQ